MLQISADFFTSQEYDKIWLEGRGNFLRRTLNLWRTVAFCHKINLVL